MANRFSPTVVPYSGPDFSTELARALTFMRQHRLDKERAEERDWERDWMEQERGRQRELEELQLAERGYKRFDEPPTTERLPERPPIFEGAKLGMANRPGASPLAQLLGSSRQERGQPLALPGQFLPELGGFSPETIWRDGGRLPREVEEIKTPDFNPMAERRRLDLGSRPRPIEVADPRWEHMTGDIYRDVEASPGAVAARQGEEEQVALAEAIRILREGTPEEASALARLMTMGDLPAGVLEHFLVPEEEEELEEGFTAEDLLAAGVEEEDIAAALKDPVLARQLVTAANRPEPRPPAGPYGYGRSREQWLEDLEAEQGVRSRYRATGRTAPSGEPGDAAYQERREAIVEALGEPATREHQIIVDELAKGKTREQILAELRAVGAPAEVIEDVELFLDGAYKGMNPFIRR